MARFLLVAEVHNNTLGVFINSCGYGPKLPGSSMSKLIRRSEILHKLAQVSCHIMRQSSHIYILAVIHAQQVVCGYRKGLGNSFKHIYGRLYIVVFPV